MSIPPGLVISTSGNEVIGAAWAQSTTSKDVFITTTNGATTVRFITNNGSGGPLNGSNFGTGIVDGWFEVDILGWSSSVQVSDRYDGRVVAANVRNLTSSSISIPTSRAKITTMGTVSIDTVNGWSNNEYKVNSSGWYQAKGIVTGKQIGRAHV